jgi:thiosulfate dehydrogenase [quinone] large subunit
MNEPAASSLQAPRCENTWAFLLLRLFLGLRTLLEGAEKFEAGGKYSIATYHDNMKHMAEGITGASFLPLWATHLFAAPLGYLLILLGAALLLGVKTRLTLILTGLLYVGLSFGLMAVQENEGVAWLGLHLALFVGALLLVRFNRFALWPDRPA